MKRLFLCSLLTGMGAALGVQVFFQRIPVLIANGDGGFYVQDAAPYAATGAIAGYMTAEGFLLFVLNRARRKESDRLKAALISESALQGLTLDQQAVLLTAIQNLEDHHNV
jgi:hypothetical protein